MWSLRLLIAILNLFWLHLSCLLKSTSIKNLWIWVILTNNTEDSIIKSGAYEYNILQFFSGNMFDSPSDCKLNLVILYLSCNTFNWLTVELIQFINLLSYESLYPSGNRRKNKIVKFEFYSHYYALFFQHTSAVIIAFPLMAHYS